jgi:hypothetical protein
MKTVFKRFMSAACLVTLAAHSPLFAEESAPVIYRLSKSASTVMGGALTNAVYWLDESGVLCAASETLDSNADYIVGLKYPDENGDTYCKNIRTGEQDIVFAGKSLTIGDDTWSYGDGVFYFSRYKGAVRFLNEGLFLRYGRMELLKHSNVEFNAYGKVTILADGTEKGNFYITRNGTLTNQTVNFHGPLVGSESAKFSISMVTARFLDASQYKGTIVCGNNSGLGMSGVSQSKVSVLTNGTIFAASAASDLTLSTLSLSTNATIKVTTVKTADANGVEHASGATIHVTDSLSTEGLAKVKLSMSDIAFDGLTNRFVVLTAPKSAELDVDDFVLDLDMGACPEDMRRLAKLAVERGEERDLLVFTFEPVVSLVTSDNNEQTACIRATTSFADGKESHWSDRRLPHEGAHYVVLKTGDVASYLNTMGVGRSENVEYEMRHFPGESLTIGSGCVLTLYQSLFKVNELRLLDGACVRLGQFSTEKKGIVKIEGERLAAPSGTVHILVYANYTAEFSGDLSGEAMIRIPGMSETGSPQGTTRFAGDNSAFEGRFSVSQENYKGNVPTATDMQTLSVAATNQLGGVIPEMAWDGISLRRMCRIYVTGNASLAKGTNRGLYIDSTSDRDGVEFYGQVKIDSEKEFAVETQLTMNGVLRKDGPGTLTLAAPVKFGSGATDDMPSANSNVLRIAEGTLKVRGADSINGLEIRFGSSAKFVIDATSCDSDSLRYGVRNVKTDTPFVLPAGSATLPLEILYPQSIPEEGAVLGVMTVRSTIASQIKAMLPEMPRRIDGKIVRNVEIVDAVNGWTTFALEIGVNHGTKVIIR